MKVLALIGFFLLSFIYFPVISWIAFGFLLIYMWSVGDFGFKKKPRNMPIECIERYRKGSFFFKDCEVCPHPDEKCIIREIPPVVRNCSEIK